MEMQIFVGIDPGSQGAICFLNPLMGTAEFYETTKHPSKLLEDFKEQQERSMRIVRAIMVEDVGPVQGVSAKANFSFGRNVGIVQTVAASTGLMVDLVPPKTWQKEVGIKGKQWPKGTNPSTKSKYIKSQLGAVCERLYPKVNIYGPKGGLKDGMADAMLIAHYCYLKHKL